MSEKARMLAGEPYDPLDAELVAMRERARDLCRGNAERNGLTNIRVAAPDDVPDDIAFSTIWSNPAIRIGKPALHAMLLRWLGHLQPDGTAVQIGRAHV